MIYAIVFAFIVLDFVTGLFKAFATHTYMSSKMREGLWHKSSLVLVVIVAVLVDVAQSYMDLGVTLPVAGAACAYISIMELGSILENVCKINPELLPEKLSALFGGLKKTDAGGTWPGIRHEDDDHE